MPKLNKDYIGRVLVSKKDNVNILDYRMSKELHQISYNIKFNQYSLSNELFDICRIKTHKKHLEFNDINMMVNI